MSAGRGGLLCTLRWPVGGIRTYLLYQYPVVAAGRRVTLVGPADESFAALTAELRAFTEVETVPVPLRGRHLPLAGVVSVLLRSGRFTVAHAQGLSAGAMTAVAARGTGVPVVVTSHDVFPPGKRAGLLERGKRRVLARMLARATAIVSVTEDAKADLLQHLPRLADGVRHETIPHGIVLPAGGPEPGLRAAAGAAEGDVLVGFLGRFMEQKGFLVLLDALDRLRAAPPKRPFRVVAVGSGDFEREYRAETQRRGLAGTVAFLPRVPDAAPVLRALDLVAMPSLWEAAGLLAMEALAAGTPLLASDCLGLREVVAGTPARTARAGDASAWAGALRAAIEDPGAEAAAAFAPEAIRRFDAAASARRTAALLDEVEARAGASSATSGTWAAGTAGRGSSPEGRDAGRA